MTEILQDNKRENVIKQIFIGCCISETKRQLLLWAIILLFTQFYCFLLQSLLMSLTLAIQQSLQTAVGLLFQFLGMLMDI